MIQVKIEDITLVNLGFVVFLKARSENAAKESNKDLRVLPIFLGLPETQALAVEMNKISNVRPLTHDIIVSILNFLDCKVLQVIIDDLVNNVFYAKILIKRKKSELLLDSRPSDAIALALKLNVPIYVSEKVMEEGSVDLNLEDSIKGKLIQQELKLLQDKLQAAIEEEHYEEAAKIRDEMRKLSSFAD